MIVKSSGEVGIGTSSPMGLLDIDASGRDAVADLDDPSDYATVIRNNSSSLTGNGIVLPMMVQPKLGERLSILTGVQIILAIWRFIPDGSTGDPLERATYFIKWEHWFRHKFTRGRNSCSRKWQCF